MFAKHIPFSYELLILSYETRLFLHLNIKGRPFRLPIACNLRTFVLVVEGYSC
nr:MAG TPA: hypothetical protein [Caudoviricetes sp.]